MNLTIPGLEAVRGRVEEIRSGRLRYAMVNLSTREPISLSVVKSGGKSDEFDHNKRPSTEELKDVFGEYAAAVSDDEAGLAIYDFAYFDSDDIQKNTLCLISYIPENLGAFKKVVYSTNALNIKNMLDIPLHIPINSRGDLTFDNIAAKCAASRMK